MKKITKTVSAFLVALSMAVMPVTARADNHNGGRQSHFSSSQSNGAGHKPRPGGNGGSQRPGNNGNNNRPSTGHRPGGGGNNNSGNHRPGNGGNNGNHRPGNGNHDYRPGHGGNGGHRPDVGHRPPGGSHRPVHPAPPPPRPHHPHYFGGGHHNHHVPFFGAYHRPTPPPRWRPGAYGPSFATILGVSFGTSVNFSIQALINSGYSVTSYGNNVVYLTNVPQMNYYWPDAALYYNNGALCGSSFTYPSNYYDMSRYNTLYNTFCGQYGVPVSTVNQGGVISATWFGYDNRYVTLEFNSNYGNYYTTLSFGI